MKASFVFTPDQHTVVEQVITPALRSTDQVSFAVTTKGERLEVTVSADTYARLQGAVNSAVNMVKLADKLLNT